MNKTWSHFYEVAKGVQVIEAESRTVIAKVSEKKGEGTWTDTQFSYARWKLARDLLHNRVEQHSTHS